MIDKKQIINGLNEMIEHERPWVEFYEDSQLGKERIEVLKKAIEIIDECEQIDEAMFNSLLEEKDVLAPVWGLQACPTCGKTFTPYEHGNQFCHNCGQKLRWKK